MLTEIQKQLVDRKRMHETRGTTSSLIFLLPFPQVYTSAETSVQRDADVAPSPSSTPPLERQIGKLFFDVPEEVVEHKLQVNAYTEGLLDNTLRKMSSLKRRREHLISGNRLSIETSSFDRQLPDTMMCAIL